MTRNQLIHVQVNGAPTVECERGVMLREALREAIETHPLPALCALVNGDLMDLGRPLEVDSVVRLIDLRDSLGWRVYRQSLCFLMSRSVSEVFPQADYAVEHSLGSGFYCRFEIDGKRGLTTDELHRLEDHMKAAVEQDLPIERIKISFADAVELFRRSGRMDKVNLLQFRNPPIVDMASCGGYADLAHGVLADRTGALRWFKLIPYESGLVLQFPERTDQPHLPAFEPQPHLFSIFKEHKEWGRILGVRTAGDLNEIIAHGDIADFIRTAEALHEKKIARIADRIAESEYPVRYVFIAGPSSSGKTTLAKRLAVHLKVNGIRAVDISLDDYFLNRDATPPGHDGKPDFEHVEAIDLAFFQEQLLAMDRGALLDRPRYNFLTGRREFRGEQIQLDDRHVAIIEGLHGLNPRLIEQLPEEKVKRVYVSALTQLNLDFDHRISTTDNRLLRRIVRDYKYRHHDAVTTLHMWPAVRRGEKKWIFPFQQEADFAFNSALDYELAVLRPMVEPLLAEVKPWHEEYAHARRLMSFIAAFLSVPPHWVPPTSILREFIGRSNFRYSS